MKPRTYKTVFIFILVLVLVSLFPGSYGASKSPENDWINPHFKVMKQHATRKLLNVDVLDYHDPGANPGHDPGKGKGLGGGPH